MCTSSPTVRKQCFYVAGVILFSSVVLAASASQSSSSSSSSSGSSSSSPSSSGPKLGFAIESEMMTYTAMDAEAEGLACGVARNIGAADERCTPRSNGQVGGVVVISAPSSAISQFQLWRSDISTMEMLTARADRYCPKTSARGASGSSLGSTILSMIPGGQVMSFAQALFSSTSESAPLEGSIIDQTLVNDVAGHLRALGISVIIPDTYMPGSLTAIDQRHSPYMSAVSALLKARACLDAKEKPEENGDQPGQESSVLNDADKKDTAFAIDAFLKSLSAAASAAPAATTTTTTTQPAAPAQPTISHLTAVLAADGMAQEIGARGGESGTWYLLSLKALESGGTQHKTGNFLGSKTTYAGGAVGTYSLFHLAGSVVCSGVFYNYVTPMQDTKIPKMLESNQTLPYGRVAGGCAASQ